MKISVAMTTYNANKFIKKQLDSILNQTVSVFEIVICDDGSSDNTIDIIKEYMKKTNITIKLYINETNLGITRNFKKALSKCSGDIIFLCDFDDIWNKDKVKIITNLFKENKNINMIGTNANLIDESDNLLEKDLWYYMYYTSSKDNLKTNYKKQLVRPILTGATAAVRKEFVSKYMIVSKYVIHDYWLSMCASITNSLYMLDLKLTNYRLHSNNMAGLKRVSWLNLFFINLFQVKYKYSSYKQRYKQNLELYNFLKKDNLDVENNLIYLKKCVYFWKIRSGLVNYKFKELIKILNDFRKNNYYKDFIEKNNNLSFVLDIYYFLILKNLRRCANIKT